MAYRNPRFCFLHAAADAGAANLTSSHPDSDYPVDNLIDYRPSSLCIFASSGANRAIMLDRGAAGLESIDRMIIPAGHNLDGANWWLQSDPTGSWPGTPRANGTAGTGLIDASFTGSTDRHWRLLIGTSGQWEIGQWYLTRTRQPTTRGIDPAWEERQVPTLREMDFPSREAMLAMAPVRWIYGLSYRALEGTDLAVFDDLMTETGVGLVPFYFDPPDDSRDVLLVRVRDYPRRTQDHPNPGAGGASFDLQFTLIEQGS
jgi:hypothetical protein